MSDSLPPPSKPEIHGGILRRSRLRRHAIELLLFTLLWTTYAYFYQSTGTNEAVRFDQIRALVLDHTLAIDTYSYNSPDLIRYPKDTGRIYPNKAPGMTFIGAIPFALLSNVFSPLKAVGLPEWIYWHLLTYLTTIFTVSLVSALAAIAMYRVLKNLTDDNYFSALIVLAIWLGTLVFPFSTLFYSHVIAGSLLTIAFYLLFELRSQSSAADGRALVYAWTAGLLIGCSVATEYPAALFAAVLGTYALWITSRLKGSTREKTTLLGMLLLGLANSGAILVLYNFSAFHNVFFIPYEAYSTPGSAFHSSYARGWMGLHWAGLSGFLHALATITIYRPMGLLYIVVGRWYVYACNPVLWLSLPGLAIMIWTRKLRPEGIVVIAMVVTCLLFISNYGPSRYEWGGGLYLGPRHIIPVLPFLALPLYFGAQKLRLVFYPLAGVSIFYMLLGTAVEPRIAFPFGDPARDFLLPDYLRGQLAQNTASLFDLAHRNLTNDSTAANLAKLAHIPGRFQLAPLMVWWFVVGATLLRLVNQKRDRFWSNATIALSLFVVAVVFAPEIHHAVSVPHSKVNGLLAKYYRNATWDGTPADIEIDRAIDFDWSKTTPYPPPFSVEWTGDMIIEREGHYLFTLLADSGALLEIDGNLVVDASHSRLKEKEQTVFLASGLHSIRVRYFNLFPSGSVKLWWTLVGRPRQIVPNEVLVPQMTRRI